MNPEPAVVARRRKWRETAGVKQALVLGGTGMLAGLTPALIDRGYWVTVIARDATRLAALGHGMAPNPPSITPLALDYHDGNKLHKWVEHVQLMQGPLDLVVAWVHEPRDEVLRIVGEEVLAYRHDAWRLIDVRGIQSRLESPKDILPETCQYQRVQLGYVQIPEGYRWLTHTEIVEGVLQTVDDPKTPVTTVGLTTLPVPSELC